MDIDPKVTCEKQTGKFVILAAINDADNKPYPLVIDPTTGELLVNDTTKPTDTYDGQKAVALIATPEALHADQAIKHSVVIQAIDETVGGNTSAVYVGNSGSQNIKLDPGESTRMFTDNLNKIYIRVLVNGEGVNYNGS